MNSTIRISFPDCIEIECSSDELNFQQLKSEIKELLKFAKDNVLRTEMNDHDVA